MLGGPTLAVLVAALSGSPGTTTQSPTASMQAELSRLVGLEVEVNADSYRIVDVAGEGAPLVGCVHREGASLYFAGAGIRLRLVGPLAVPRIAGPNYKVWVMGKIEAGTILYATRLGIVSGPSSSGCTSGSKVEPTSDA